MPIQILPSIDLRNGQVVRLKQGDYARQVNYAVSPFDTADAFREAGAEWMHLVDLDGAKDGKPVQTDLIAQIIDHNSLKVEVGGGVRTTDDVRRLLDAGAARVVVGTAAMENWDWFKQLVHTPGMESKIVLALDAKEGVVATRGWTATSGKLAVDVAKEVGGWPIGALLYTDVAKDGMLQGPNFDETRKLTEAGEIPVIASGGVGTLDHVRTLATLPVWGAIIGRSLYEGTVDLAEAIRIGRGETD
jgi:phosphoribosylformimino-5-aminoimidazole carboxamide ribotide isomerase